MIPDKMVEAACASYFGGAWDTMGSLNRERSMQIMRSALQAAQSVAALAPAEMPEVSNEMVEAACIARWHGPGAWTGIPAGIRRREELLMCLSLNAALAKMPKEPWSVANSNKAGELTAAASPPSADDAPAGERERFEAAMRGEPYSHDLFARRTDGDYLYARAELAWRAWQKARAAAPDAPVAGLGWQVVEVKNEGDYGDGGPDCRTGFTSYAIADAEGRILFDSLNCDHRVCEVHEEFDGDDGYRTAWDEPSRKRAELIVARMNAAPDAPRSDISTKIHFGRTPLFIDGKPAAADIPPGYGERSGDAPAPVGEIKEYGKAALFCCAYLLPPGTLLYTTPVSAPAQQAQANQGAVAELHISERGVDLCPIKGVQRQLRTILGDGIHSLFAAPQAANGAIPPEMKLPPLYADEGREEQYGATKYAAGWNDCRAKMLSAPADARDGEDSRRIDAIAEMVSRPLPEYEAGRLIRYIQIEFHPRSRFHNHMFRFSFDGHGYSGETLRAAIDSAIDRAMGAEGGGS